MSISEAQDTEVTGLWSLFILQLFPETDYEIFPNSVSRIRDFLPPWSNSPQWAMTSLSRLHDHTQTHHTQYGPFGRVISPTQTPPPDNKHSQQTTVHASGEIRNRSSSKRAADPRLRPRGHWDRQSNRTGP
jgi:hypothetical protein